MAYAILRTQKLKAGVAVHRSLKHAFREQDTPNADLERTPDNSHFGADNVAQGMAAFNARLPAKFRKDAVQCIEYLVTGSPDGMERMGRAGQDAYFASALTWLRDRHGAENVIYAGIHRDETTPHLCAYVVPRDGEKLNAKKWLGAANALGVMQTEFADKVGRRHGLERGVQNSKANHKPIRQFYAEMQASQDMASQHGTITPEDLIPLRSKANGLLGAVGLASNVETPADVASRLTERVRPIVLQADQVHRENKRLRGELDGLRKQVWNLADQAKAFGDLVMGLTREQIAKVTALASGMRQQNDAEKRRNAELEAQKQQRELAALKDELYGPRKPGRSR